MSIIKSPRRSRGQTGFSLVELMIALVVGLFLLLALTAFVVGNLQANRQAVNAAKLNQELRFAMDVISREIRRANYLPNIQGEFGLNPSVPLPNTIVLGGLGGNCSAAGCDRLQYAYSGTPKVFDLNAGVIRLESEALTDPGVVTITDLNFCFVDTNSDADPTNNTCGQALPTANVLTAGGNAMRIQLLRASITGQLVSDPMIVKTINQTIRVRNDALGPS
jgi:prepilin-type N-terminal cleavage/methylation domain-containing protein